MIDAHCTALMEEFGLSPVMAAEIECYVMLVDAAPATLEAFWQPVDAAFRAEGLPILRIEQERGAHQFEIVTQVTTPLRLAHTLSRIRALIEAAGAAQAIATHFAAKPFAGQPSSGMHLHLHLADAEGLNSYHKTEDWTSDSLRYSLGGLLALLPEQMPIFFPTHADHQRLEDADHVPKIRGWGVNNRYCALRIPADPDLYHKRIEHRMPCANARPEAAIAAMLEGVLHGLRGRIEPPEQVYGKT